MSAEDFFDADDCETAPPAKNANPMPDVMIDLETMGTRPNAPVIAIGAVTFDSRKMVLGERFYCNVDLASSVALGSIIDPGTVMWWMGQSDEARKSLTKSKPLQVALALQTFAEWLDRNAIEKRSRKVWGNAPSFDCTLLSEHFRKASMDVPWEFWNERDFRTFRNLWPNVELDERKGTYHNALDDAEHQVNHIFKIRRTLRGNT